MAIGIEWPLKSVRHISAAGIARRCHRPRSPEAPAAGATNEKQFAVFVCVDGCERFGDSVNKASVLAVAWKSLPLHLHRPLPDRGQVRQANIGPLGHRPHADQHQVRVTLQPGPCLFHRNGIDLDITTHAASHSLYAALTSDDKTTPRPEQRRIAFAHSSTTHYKAYLAANCATLPELRILGLHSERSLRITWRRCNRAVPLQTL